MRVPTSSGPAGEQDLRARGAGGAGRLTSVLGLYIHVPFCSAICNYCNFNRGLFDGDLKARYVDALLREIHEQSFTGAGASTFAPSNSRELRWTHRSLGEGGPPPARAIADARP